MPAERTDLNLFRVFDAVMRHQNLVAAGRELGITSSAVSHALQRLRNTMGDDLFVAGVRRMTPTRRAVELAPRIAGALAGFDDVLARKPFDPSKADRSFKVAMSDYNAVILLPSVLQQLLVQAPSVRLCVVPSGRTDLIEQLDEGRLDAVVSWFGQTPDRIRRKELFRDRETVVVRRDHPLTLGEPSEAALLSFPQLVVELTGTNGRLTDGFHDERGVQRRVWIDRLIIENGTPEETASKVNVTVQSYELVITLLRRTDLVATLPFRLAREKESGGDFAMLKLPYVPLEVAVEVAWHERSDRDPGLQWLLGVFAGAASDLSPLPVNEQDSSLKRTMFMDCL